MIKCNTILYCKNWKECVEFFSKIMGFPIHLEKDWFVEFIINENSFISIADEKRSTVKSCAGKGITLSFKVSSARRILKRFENKGIKSVLKTHPWGGKYFFIKDPEGNRIEIWSDQ